MAKTPGELRTTLSSSIRIPTRELLVARAKKTGKTMSDLVDELITTAFSPKRGLAKRLSKLKAEAKSKLESQLLELELELTAAQNEATQQLTAAQSEFNVKSSNYREKHSRVSENCRKEADLVTQTADSTWLNSYQHIITKSYEAKDSSILSRWLFDSRIFGTVTRYGQKVAMSEACIGAISYVNSPMIPDKLEAVDIAAEAEFFTVTEEQFSLMLSHFSYDSDLMYEAFMSDIGSEQGHKFLVVLREACELLGGSCYENCRGNGLSKLKPGDEGYYLADS